MRLNNVESISRNVPCMESRVKIQPTALVHFHNQKRPGRRNVPVRRDKPIRGCDRTMTIPTLADLYGGAGRAAEGLALVENGLRVALASGFAMMVPDLYRCKGDLLLANGSPEGEAEACFQQAIESAGRIEAKSWELRAGLSLCRLWQRQGKVDAARVLLSPICGWFTEGFDTPDLQEAGLLLKELAR